MTEPPIAGPSTQPTAQPTPVPHRDALESLRSNILQLVESIDTLGSQIEAGGNAGMASWPDLMSRYGLLLSHTYSISSQLIPPPSTGPVPGETAQETSERAKTWTKTLARVVALPTHDVAPDKQFLVGALLRTRLLPDLEKANQDLIATLPPSLAVVDPHAELAEGTLDRLKRAMAKHDEVARHAIKKLSVISCLVEAEDSSVDEDDESNYYDWKMRLPDEEEDLDETAPFKMNDVETTREVDDNSPTLQQLASWMRKGRISNVSVR